MSSESAFTATGSVTGPLVSASSRAVSAASSSTSRASRRTARPCSVTRTGRDRTSSTRPVACSSALSRWLIADGVTCSSRAAASSVPGVHGGPQRAQLGEVRVHEATLTLRKERALGFSTVARHARPVTAPLLALLSGLGLGLAMIVAVGAQNAFVLRQGLRGEHVVAVVAVCLLSDVLLIGAGVAGTGALLDRAPQLRRRRAPGRSGLPARVRGTGRPSGPAPGRRAAGGRRGALARC